MFSLLKPIASLLKSKQIDIYNNVFKLHTKITVTFLLAFSVLVSAKEYFGTAIDCIYDHKERKQFVDNLCWINGTYTFRNLTGHIGTHMISHGVNGKTQNERLYQRYYQWIVMLLIIQALIFYVPAFLWKIWEKGRIRQLCKNLDAAIIFDDNENLRKNVIRYFLSDNRQIHQMYAIRFLMCEIMNFFAVCFNIFLMQMVFADFWKEYAPAIGAVFSRNWSKWEQHTAVIFPKLAKCDFSLYGQSGSIQITDALCLLSLNVLNEKIFAFLWLWFIVLFCVSTLNIMYRCLLLSSAKLRIQLLQSITMPLTYGQISCATNKGHFGDWFVLYQCGRNLNSFVFREIVEDLAEELKAQKKKYESTIFV